MFAQAAIQSLQSKESCRRRRRRRGEKKRKGGMYPGQAFLFISRLADSGGVSSTLYSTALCIFHIESPFMFYARQLRGEQLCGRRVLCKFRRRERERERQRTHFSGRSGAECQTHLRTNSCCKTEALPQLLHYHNTRRQQLARRHGSNLKTD